MINKLDKWHQTKPGLLVFAIAELALAYGFASLAIDRGNFLYYALALLFLVGGLRNITKLIGTLTYGRRQKRR